MIAIDHMDAIKPTGELEKISSLLGLTAQENLKLAFSLVDSGNNENLLELILI